MDADYPDQQVYFLLHKRVFQLTCPCPNAGGPYPGNTYKFTVDLEAKSLIPLGITDRELHKGSFTVNIAVDTDTVSTLIAAEN